MSNLKASKVTKFSGLPFHLSQHLTISIFPSLTLNQRSTGSLITGLGAFSLDLPSTSSFSRWPCHLLFVALGFYFGTQFIYYHLHESFSNLYLQFSLLFLEIHFPLDFQLLPNNSTRLALIVCNIEHVYNLTSYCDLEIKANLIMTLTL